jgi:exodeoxyribonuclease VII small subunit
MAKKESFEDKMKKLDKIVDFLDIGEAPLEEMLRKYELGMKLAKEMREFLNKAELKVVEISKDLDMLEDLDEFDESENIEDEIDDEFSSLLVDDDFDVDDLEEVGLEDDDEFEEDEEIF